MNPGRSGFRVDTGDGASATRRALERTAEHAVRVLGRAHHGRSVRRAPGALRPDLRDIRSPGRGRIRRRTADALLSPAPPQARVDSSADRCLLRRRGGRRSGDRILAADLTATSPGRPAPRSRSSPIASTRSSPCALEQWGDRTASADAAHQGATTGYQLYAGATTAHHEVAGNPIHAISTQLLHDRSCPHDHLNGAGPDHLDQRSTHRHHLGATGADHHGLERPRATAR